MGTKTITTYFNLFRVDQYAKNAFIFIPLFFAGEIFIPGLFLEATYAFICFSLVASAIYIINDLFDIKEDRLHPDKKTRPLASGEIQKKEALILASLSVIAGFGLSAILLPAKVMSLILLYVTMNVAYTLKLKHIPVVDITIVAVGFVLRLFVGSLACNIPLTSWIIIMTFLLALFIGFAKRRDDIMVYAAHGEKTRKNIDGYSLEYVHAGMTIMASITIVSYIMYTLSPTTIAKFRTDKLFFTTLFVILGVLRYLQVAIVENKSGSPTEVLLRDRFLQICILLWFLSYAVIIYTMR